MKIFIVGGTSGMGLAMARFYTEKGHVVGVCGRNLEKLDNNMPFKTYKADVTDMVSLNVAIKHFTANMPLDLLVDFAGSYAEDVVLEITYAQAENMLKTNILGSVNVLETGKDIMVPQQSGQIVLVASVSGILNYQQSSLYTKTKRSIIQIADAYRRALSPYGVSVGVMAPGYVNTQKLRELNNADLSKKPFLIEENKAVSLMVKAIAEKRSFYIFPRKMKWLIKSLSVLPPFILNIIMNRKALWMKQN
ncbi:MAG: SDR family NAD(P)-dependent oxidoreductase [Aestuariibaculum sp.]